MRFVLNLNPTEEFARQIVDLQIKFFEYDSDDINDLTEIYYSIPEGYVVAYDGEEIIGCVNLLKRQITFENTTILLGGLGGVCVKQESRNKGIAKEMLTMAMEQLKKWNCDMAYLCTESASKLYEFFGFVNLNREKKTIGKSGKEYVSSDAMIASVCSKEKFDLVLHSHSIFDIQGGDW